MKLMALLVEIRLMSLFDNHGIVERASIYKDTHGLLMENQIFPFVSCKKDRPVFNSPRNILFCLPAMTD